MIEPLPSEPGFDITQKGVCLPSGKSWYTIYNLPYPVMQNNSIDQEKWLELMVSILHL